MKIRADEMTAVIKEQFEPIRSADTEMMATLGTNFLAFFHCLTPDDLSTGLALLPKALGSYALLAFFERVSFKGRFLPCEPRHYSSP